MYFEVIDKIFDPYLTGPCAVALVHLYLSSPYLPCYFCHVKTLWIMDDFINKMFWGLSVSVHLGSSILKRFCQLSWLFPGDTYLSACPWRSGLLTQLLLFFFSQPLKQCSDSADGDFWPLYLVSGASRVCGVRCGLSGSRQGRNFPLTSDIGCRGVISGKRRADRPELNREAEEEDVSVWLCEELWWLIRWSLKTLWRT